MFVGNIYPLLLLIFGIRKVHLLRENNFGCGDGIADPYPDNGVWYHFFCALLVTYALELLVWPSVLANHIIRVLRRKSLVARNHDHGRVLEKTAERLEQYVGMFLKLLQCLTCNKADFKNKGELKEFAVHFVSVE